MPLRHVTQKEQSFLHGLETYKKLYLDLTASESKDASLDGLIQLVKPQIKSKSPVVWEGIARTFLHLNRRDQNNFKNKLGEKDLNSVHKQVFKILKIKNETEPPYFSPLLFLAPICTPEPLPLSPESILNAQILMPELYKQILGLLPTDDAKLLFHHLLESSLTRKKKIKPSTILSPIHNRFDPFLRMDIFKYAHGEKLFFAATTSHPLIHDEQATLDNDPYADDLAFTTYQKKGHQVQLLSISDGGGKGENASMTAKLVNTLFLTHASSKKVPSPHEVIPFLLSSLVDTEIEIRNSASGHATHATACSISLEDSIYGGISLLGDCTAYLILIKSGKIQVEKLRPLSEEKLVSCCAGSFNKIGDYSSLYACQFEIGRDIEHAFILLGSDGLEDNLHPKNQLSQPYSEKIDKILSNPTHYYKRQFLSENNRTLTEALLSPFEQKDKAFLGETHRFPTPYALYQYLIQCPSLEEEEKAQLLDPGDKTPWAKWDQTAFAVKLYQTATIRDFFSDNLEDFIMPLARHIRLQAKPDDILIAALKVK